jgi:serine/threonine protein kinase
MSIKNYSNLKIVGSGSFGSVYQAIDLETEETVAIKQILLSKFGGIGNRVHNRFVNYSNFLRLRKIQKRL